MSGIDEFKDFVVYHNHRFHVVHGFEIHDGKICIVYKNSTNGEDTGGIVYVPINSPLIKASSEVVESYEEATAKI